MARFLLIENNKAEFPDIRDRLQRHGHEVIGIFSDVTGENFEQARAYLQTHVSDDQPLDFMILDIHFTDNALGGIEVYNALIRAGLRKRWGHTLICSQFADFGPQGAKYQNLIGFMMGAFIPKANLITKYNRTGSADPLIERVEQLLQEDEGPVLVEVWHGPRAGAAGKAGQAVG